MTNTCHHNRNVMWGCSECELEGKLLQLRVELSELRHECQRRLEVNNTLHTRNGALTEERDSLKARVAELEQVHKWRTGRAFQGIEEENRAENGMLRDRIAQLENELESDGEEQEKMFSVICELEEKARERAGRIGALEVELENERMKVFELEKAANEKEWLAQKNEEGGSDEVPQSE